MKNSRPVVKYIGDGTFLPGCPARDLSEEEVQRYGLSKLLVSGLYEEIKPEPPKKAADQEVKDGSRD